MNYVVRVIINIYLNYIRDYVIPNVKVQFNLVTTCALIYLLISVKCLNYIK